MATFTVYVRRGGYSTPRDLVILNQRFSWAAAFAPVLWSAYNRDWRAVLGYLAWGLFILPVLTVPLAASPEAQAAVFVGVFCLQGWTAYDVRSWTLTRSGYDIVSWADAPDADAALLDVLHADADLCADIAAPDLRPVYGA